MLELVYHFDQNADLLVSVPSSESLIDHEI